MSELELNLLERVEEARAEHRVGVILSQNVDDYFVGRTGKRPIRLNCYALLCHLADEGFHTATVSLSGGVKKESPPGIHLGASPFEETPSTGEAAGGPAELLRRITPVLRDNRQKTAVLVRHAAHLAPSAGELGASVLQPEALERAEIFYEWSIDERIRQVGNFVILCDPEEQLHELLARQAGGYKQIRLGYPHADERQVFIKACLERDGHYGPLEAELDAEALAAITGGLALTEIESLLRGANVRSEPLTRSAVCRERAAKISERLHDIAEVKDPTIGFEDIAGLANVKEHFLGVAEAARQGPTALSGATLLVGIPGVGKSYTASALALALGVLIIFVRNLFHGLVGGSEAKVEKLIRTCQAFDGVVVVFEEIDQMLGKRSEGQSLDSGTSQRVLGRLMEFMGGGYPGIHFVGLTNRPDLLDFANLDRFGALLPVLHPSESDVEELLPVLARQLGRRLAQDVQVDQIARHPDLHNVSVRALLNVLREAGRLADSEKGGRSDEIGHEQIATVTRMYQPTTDAIEAEFVALTAIAGCDMAPRLPWMSWQGLRPGASIPSYLTEIVDAETGAVDRQRLQQRLDELRELRRMRR